MSAAALQALIDKCCLDPGDVQCEQLPANLRDRSNVTNAACKNLWVSKCATSANLPTPPCQSWIRAIHAPSPPLPDMDGPIVAFCATQRDPGDPFHKMCDCVNFSNTCSGREIMASTPGNPGCFYPGCKKPDVLKTSDLQQPHCKSVNCSVGDITIKAGAHSKINVANMIKQKCSATLPSPDTPPVTPVLNVHTHSRCVGTSHMAGKDLSASTASDECSKRCAAHDECEAYQMSCDAHGKCACTLHDSAGYVASKHAGDTCYDAARHSPFEAGTYAVAPRAGAHVTSANGEPAVADGCVDCHFVVEPSKEGAYTLKHVSTSRYLDASPKRVTLASSPAAWRIEPNGDGEWSVRHGATGGYLEASGSALKIQPSRRSFRFVRP